MTSLQTNLVSKVLAGATAGGGRSGGQAGPVEGGFPRETAVFVVVTQVSPAHRSPPLLAQPDGPGSFQAATSFGDPAEYVFSACVYQRKDGGSWDCGSGTPQSRS